METVNVPELPTIRIKGKMSVYLKNLDVYLGKSAKNFKQCGLMFDKEPTKNKGILRLSIAIPSVGFDLHEWHFTSGPFHGTGSAEGHVAVHIEVPVHYSVKPPSLHCEDIVVKSSNVGLALHGGAIYHPIVAKLTGIIKGQISKQIPTVAKQEACPAMNKIFNKCLAVSKTWPDIVTCLSSQTPPPSLANSTVLV